MTRETDAPSFAERFPKDPLLDPLLAAFARGDFARVRREGRGVIQSSASPEVRAAVLELLRRTRPDPLSAVIFALAAALLVLLSGYWWWKAGGRP